MEAFQGFDFRVLDSSPTSPQSQNQPDINSQHGPPSQRKAQLALPPLLKSSSSQTYPKTASKASRNFAQGALVNHEAATRSDNSATISQLLGEPELPPNSMERKRKRPSYTHLFPPLEALETSSTAVSSTSAQPFSDPASAGGVTIPTSSGQVIERETRSPTLVNELELDSTTAAAALPGVTDAGSVLALPVKPTVPPRRAGIKTRCRRCIIQHKGCDRGKPSCGLCIKVKHECVYDTDEIMERVTGVVLGDDQVAAQRKRKKPQEASRKQQAPKEQNKVQEKAQVVMDDIVGGPSTNNEGARAQKETEAKAFETGNSQEYHEPRSHLWQIEHLIANEIASTSDGQQLRSAPAETEPKDGTDAEFDATTAAFEEYWKSSGNEHDQWAYEQNSSLQLTWNDDPLGSHYSNADGSGSGLNSNLKNFVEGRFPSL